MSNSTSSRGRAGIIIAVAATVLVIGVIVAVFVVYPTEEASSPAEPTKTVSKADRSKMRRMTREGKGTPYKGHSKIRELIAKHGNWNPPRPLRFVVRYGDRSDKGLTKEAAQAFAEEIRERFAKGEDSFTLIRENSDPPTGIPGELLKQWQDLPPTESSPVVPIEGGFALFFGTPSEPPPTLEAQ